MTKEIILVTGASGQIGTELVPALVERYGAQNVISLDIRKPSEEQARFEEIDALDKDAFEAVVRDNKVTHIYHLASLLSATGEKIPLKTWELNVQSLRYVLEFAREYNTQVFWPSSIAVFGPTTPRNNTPQQTIIVPTTMYGITKSAGELLCNYYHQKLGVDVRSVRYPGLVSWKQEPGGGTTDYAVDIFYKGLQTGAYECFVSRDTILPMMYMDDAIRATLDLMDADASKLSIHTSYNLAAISFTVEELAKEVQKYIPKLEVTYVPDARQKIADSWPQSIDDSIARQEWGWHHTFDLEKMTSEMIAQLRKKFKNNN